MNITVIPPKNCDPSNIRHEFKQLQSGFVDIATYPNGVELVFTNINGRGSIESSKPLIKIDDCTYQSQTNFISHNCDASILFHLDGALLLPFFLVHLDNFLYL